VTKDAERARGSCVLVFACLHSGKIDGWFGIPLLAGKILGTNSLAVAPLSAITVPFTTKHGWCSEARLKVTKNYARAVDIVDGARTLRLQKKAPAEAGAGIETRIELKKLS